MTLPTPRFVVRSVTGRAIRADSGGGAQTKRPMPTSYYVQDRWYCWQVVAAFDVPEKGGNYMGGDTGRLALAEARCAELNAELA